MSRHHRSKSADKRIETRILRRKARQIMFGHDSTGAKRLTWRGRGQIKYLPLPEDTETHGNGL